MTSQTKRPANDGENDAEGVVFHGEGGNFFLPGGRGVEKSQTDDRNGL
jgi:hypothetical protein